MFSPKNPVKRKLTQQEAYKLGTDHQFIDSIKLGPWASYSLLHDPRHMGFVLARYKFCAKMFDGMDLVLEVGCGDGFGTPVIAQATKKVIAIEPEVRHIRGNRQRLNKIQNVEFRRMDICTQAPEEKFDGAFSIDVIEHLDKPLNQVFFENQCACLKADGVCIVGTPNIHANKYASARSRVQHINLQSQESLKKMMSKYFKRVFMFGMNDEILHTGYAPMCHYIFAMGVGLK
jgi:2-polyprenyl-3-methyl-5-hydroxy-6-metoxy-1,4-benzoquinol methylase